MKPLFVFSFLLFALSMFSQNFKIEYVKKERSYLFQNKYYKYNELKPIFSQFRDSKELYKDYKTVDNIGNVFLIGGVTLTFIGVAGIKPPEHCDFICAENSGAFLSLLIGIPTTGAGLLIKLINLGNRKKPIEAFNSHFSKDLSFLRNPSELKLITSLNGLGLQLTF